MVLLKKHGAYMLRLAAFAAAALAFIFSMIPGNHEKMIKIIHAVLWVYAFIFIIIKLRQKPPVIKGKGSYLAKPAPSGGVIILSVAVWISLVLAGWGIFSLLPFANLSLLVLAVSFLGVLELIFVNSWCPFAKFITHSRCCQTCRLKNWGEAMVLSPLIVMPSWWTLLLIVLSAMLIVKYEILYKKYPFMLPQNAACTACAKQCNIRNKKEPKTETLSL